MKNEYSIISKYSRLFELTELEHNWDTYGGIPLRPEIAFLAAFLLEEISNEKTPMPQFVPGSDGNVQLEWHTKKHDLEIDIISFNHIELYYEEDGTSIELMDLKGDLKGIQEMRKFLSIIEVHHNSKLVKGKEDEKNSGAGVNRVC